MDLDGGPVDIDIDGGPVDIDGGPVDIDIDLGPVDIDMECGSCDVFFVIFCGGPTFVVVLNCALGFGILEAVLSVVVVDGLLVSEETLGNCEANVDRVGLLDPSLVAVSSLGLLLPGKDSDLGGTDDELSNCLSSAFWVIFPSAFMSPGFDT